ncbi:3D domain-containing protein [Clostridium sp. CCUG 7971]|uniref:3D domain-containing protein n=1 Tax=Clostridium sp. CCUG 7971 TaxID=2811414 RepID=UPI001ABA07C4|nr:3D domain-containing protein [Clostridium sp. CCUG 7971]MBO3443239.1 G5 domain-containing protein [Clostridium sp. CCUG 7971]
MNLKNNKTLKVSVLAGLLSVGILAGGYSILNKDITLVVKGEETSVSTFKSTVKEILEEQNVKYDGNDIVSVDLDSKLKDGSKIEIIDVKEEVIKENKEVPFEVNVVEDNNLLKGKTEIKTEGQAGKNELVYKITYHNGKQMEKKFVEELVSVEPVNKIVKKGTKVEVQVASSRGSNTGRKANVATTSTVSAKSNSSSSKGKHMKVVATAYSGDTVTSTGTKPKWGTIAVDPSVIPYGTKVYIPQFGQTFIAEDCGGAIKGNKIDIFMNDESTVKNWGRKTIDIYIVG